MESSCVDEMENIEYGIGQNEPSFHRMAYAVHRTGIGGPTHLAVERDRFLIICRVVGIGRSMRVLTPVPRFKNLNIIIVRFGFLPGQAEP